MRSKDWVRVELMFGRLEKMLFMWDQLVKGGNKKKERKRRVVVRVIG